MPKSKKTDQRSYSKDNASGVEDSDTLDSEQGQDASYSTIDLLSATLKSSVRLFFTIVQETKKTQEEVVEAVCRSLPRDTVESLGDFAGVVAEKIDQVSTSTVDSFASVSREEFDFLKLDVIKLKSQVEELIDKKAE